MNSSRVKRHTAILDCCFSGAFDPSLQAKDDGSLELQRQLGAEGRVVLASSSSTQYSFEQKGENLSIYTKHIVEGIETGAADQNGDGQISILELHDYTTKKVQDEVPNVTPKIIVLKDMGFNIVIANTKNEVSRLSKDKDEEKIDFGNVQLKATQDLEDSNRIAYSPIPSLIQSLIPFIERLIEQFRSHYLVLEQDNASSTSVNMDFILESIRRASDAEFVFLINGSIGRTNWTISSQSSLDCETDKTEYVTLIKQYVLSNISVESIFTTGYHGIHIANYDENTSTNKAFVFVPLDSLDENVEFIVICDLPTTSPYLNDAYTKIISSFYSATQIFYLYPSRIEAIILDDLKRNYGFLPLLLYNRRFEIFCERINQIDIYFQPILDLDRVVISHWEALARDLETLRAPIDLFDAAELWGRQFTTELDIRFLERAAERYENARVKLQTATNSNDVLAVAPLSVNVYPESLMRDAYYRAVEKITRSSNPENYLSNHLILEISEKTSLPKYVNGIRLRNPLETFKERLLLYRRNLKIKFGIDDFGVGYSSVSRLASLNPPYVKIDRDILHQLHADVIIRFVKDLVDEASQLRDSAIIIEGVDESSPINLYALRKLGVGYVQGYRIGKAAPEIYRLTPENRRVLRDEIFNFGED